MSFLDSIIDVGKSVIGFVTGSGIGSQLVKAVVTGYTLNKVSNSINKASAKTTASSSKASPSVVAKDTGQAISISPTTENKIPVVYGRAITPGIITDVRMSGDNQKMYYALTICEVTGTKMSDSLASSFTFNDIYLNGNRIVFQSGGTVASYMVDPSGNIDRSISGLIKIYCYNNGSATQVLPANYTGGTMLPAYDGGRMLNWGAAHTMNSLVFAIVQVTYSKDKGVTSLGNMSFDISNSMTLPGDCLYDYMISTRYGASIPAGDISFA